MTDGPTGSHATPEVCLRREYVTPTWGNRDHCQDQTYFSDIVKLHRWSEEKGEIVILREALCRSNENRYDGLRGGNL